MTNEPMETANPSAVAQIFDGSGRPLRRADRPLPDRLEAGELLVAVDLATLCGSDIHTILGHRQEPVPCILGHEGVGRVVVRGSGRRTVQVGDRVSWSIADSCGRCAPCATYGLPQKCTALFKYGHAALDDGTGLNGCYASHIILRAGTHVVPVPDTVPDAVAAPANCALATMVHAVSRLPDPCRSVVVQGAGLLGIYGCALLHERGVEQIYCVDIHPDRLRLVSAFGGIPVDARRETAEDRIATFRRATGDGVDAVLEVAGVPEVVPEGIRLLRPGGYYALIGLVHPRSQLDLTGEQLIRGQVTLFGIHNYAPAHLDEAIRFLETTIDRYPYADLVSPPLPLAELEQAVALARTQTWHRVAVRSERQVTSDE